MLLRRHVYLAWLNPLLNLRKASIHKFNSHLQNLVCCATYAYAEGTQKETHTRKFEKKEEAYNQ